MPSLLDGIKIVESTTIITGSLAGCLLGDLGASIVKVESRGQRRAGLPMSPHRRRRRYLPRDAAGRLMTHLILIGGTNASNVFDFRWTIGGAHA